MNKIQISARTKITRTFSNTSTFFLIRLCTLADCCFGLADVIRSELNKFSKYYKCKLTQKLQIIFSMIKPQFILQLAKAIQRNFNLFVKIISADLKHLKVTVPLILLKKSLQKFLKWHKFRITNALRNFLKETKR